MKLYICCFCLRSSYCVHQSCSMYEAAASGFGSQNPKHPPQSVCIFSGRRIHSTVKQKRYLIVAIMLILLGAYILFFLPSSSQISPLNEIFEPDAPYVHRNEWKAEFPKSISNFSKPPTRIIVKQTNQTFCNTFLKCSEEVRKLQLQHMRKGLTDIRYNFLIGGDGRIYEGRGWNVPNEESTDSIDIAFIGNFFKDVVSSLMAQRAQDLITEGYRSTVDYKDRCNFVEIWNVTNIQKVQDKIKTLTMNRSC